jgi:zinc transport system permease protein
MLIMTLSFFYIPFLYSVLFSALSGPIGSLILWRRMSFFGETIAHASLLGFVLQYLLGWPLEFSMSIVAVGYCLLLELFDYQELDQSSFLPMLSYGVMGCSLILIEKVVHNPSLVYTVLIGDILLVRPYDCQLILGLLMIVTGSLFYFYRPLILVLFSKELAQLHYKNVRMMSFLMNLLIALSVAIAVQTVGILLAMAMLTMPSLTAFYSSSSPKGMIFWSSMFAIVFSVVGFVLSLSLNLAVGPTISIVALIGHFCVRLTLAAFR